MITDFDKQCLEKIPPNDLKKICEFSFYKAKAAFGDLRSLSFAYCTECEKKIHNINGLRKVPCIVSILDKTALCSSHYLEKIQRESCKEYLDKHSLKLDLKDFARI